MTEKALSLRRMRICVTEEELRHGDVFYCGQNNHNRKSYLNARCDKEIAKSLNDLLDVERNRIINAINHKENKFFLNQLNKKSMDKLVRLTPKPNQQTQTYQANTESEKHASRRVIPESQRRRKDGVFDVIVQPIIIIENANELGQVANANHDVINSTCTTHSLKSRRRSVSCCDIYNQSNDSDACQLSANKYGGSNRNVSNCHYIDTSTEVFDSDVTDWESDITDDEIAEACGLNDDEHHLVPFSKTLHRRQSRSHNDIDRYGDTFALLQHTHIDTKSTEQGDSMKAFTDLRDRFRKIRKNIQAQRGCSFSESSVGTWALAPHHVHRLVNNATSRSQRVVNSPKRPAHLPSLERSALDILSCNSLSKSLDLPRASFNSMATLNTLAPPKAGSTAHSMGSLSQFPKTESSSSSSESIKDSYRAIYDKKRAVKHKRLMKRKPLDPLKDIRFTNLVNTIK